MELRRFTIFVAILTVVATSFGQTRFRSGIFLHHSTGGRIWGPNGGTVSVPTEIDKYNLSHGLLGTDAVKMTEATWPDADNNEWTIWHDIFDNRDPVNDIRPLLASYPVIMIKSCFPSSQMTGLGTRADTLDPTIKSTANYKWHWRSLISVMKGRPQNFFIIWTNAPLVAGVTNASQTALSDAFCRWAKDTLAVGLDPVVGAFPRNIFVFDLFHYLANASGVLPPELASGPLDSHPNADATAWVTPKLVKQVFDAALAYGTLAEVGGSRTTIPETPQLDQNYPNPFNPSTEIGFGLPGLGSSWVKLAVYDLLGREVAVLVNEKKEPGSYSVQFNGTSLASGVYLYRIQAGDFVSTKRLLLLK